jgi:hypothetical protein
MGVYVVRIGMCHLGLPPPHGFRDPEVPGPCSARSTGLARSRQAALGSGPDGRTLKREGNLSKASIVKDQSGSPSGLPGISLAERLAQFPAFLVCFRKKFTAEIAEEPSRTSRWWSFDREDRQSRWGCGELARPARSGVVLWRGSQARRRPTLLSEAKRHGGRSHQKDQANRSRPRPFRASAVRPGRGSWRPSLLRSVG